MKNLTVTDRDGVSWSRVNKRRARSAYNAGRDVIISPVYADPFGPWCLSVKLNRGEQWYSDNFDSLVFDYEYYNCNSECGKYAAYYVRTEVL